MADFPNIEPDLEEIALIANNQVYNSPLTGQAQTASLTGAKWQCTPTFSNRNGKEARDLRAFLFDQEGVSGRFNYYPASIDNIGTHSGVGVVDGAGQTGKSLLTKGWDADQPLLFSAGDYLTVNGEMKMVTADVAVDQDYIEYDAVNYATNPFSPLDYDFAAGGEMTQIEGANPSGSAYYGKYTLDAVGGFLEFDFSSRLNAKAGDTLYACALMKKADAEGFSTYFRINYLPGNEFLAGVVKEFDGVDLDSYTYIDMGDEWFVVRYEYTLATDQDDIACEFIIRDADGVTGSVGTSALVQAVFFGVSDGFPDILRANATIPITPSIRVSPSDENAIEVENPYFPARLDTDDMSRLQVSAPVIYNTTLSIVEDF